MPPERKFSNQSTQMAMPGLISSPISTLKWTPCANGRRLVLAELLVSDFLGVVQNFPEQPVGVWNRRGLDEFLVNFVLRRHP